MGFGRLGGLIIVLLPALKDYLVQRGHSLHASQIETFCLDPNLFNYYSIYEQINVLYNQFKLITGNLSAVWDYSIRSIKSEAFLCML